MENNENLVCYLCCTNKAEVQCHCSNPSLFFCKECIAEHIFSQSSVIHTQSSLEITGNYYTNFICKECCKFNAEYVCLCSDSIQTFCDSCLGAHIKKFSLSKKSHEIEPIESLEFLHEIGEISEFLDRKVNVRKIRDALELQIKNLGRFGDKIIEEKNELIKLIEDAVNSKLEVFNRYKNYYLKLIEELDQIKFSRELDNQSCLGHLLGISLSHIDKSLKRAFAVHMHTNFDLAFKSVSDLIEFEGPKLPDIVSERKMYYFKTFSQEVTIFNPFDNSLLTKEIDHSITFKNNSSWCVISPESLLYCGGSLGSSYSGETYTIDLVSNKIKKAGNMIIPRSQAAIVYYENEVYIFGGFNGNNIKACEKLSLKSLKWERMPDMNHARSSFTVAILNGLFYMAGMGGPEIEVYNPLENSFQLFGLSLPKNCVSTMISVENKIFIFLQDKVISLDPEYKTFDLQCTTRSNLWWSGCPPLVLENRILLYSCISAYELWQYDAKSQVMSLITKI